MKKDYERFMQDLEQIAQRMADINVAGIPDGLTDDLTKCTVAVLALKRKAKENSK